ncbi:hypothetical protein [Cumulibacter soli]|uniref:hypothetical protein n=1 Tax=Cumulibacter soli TaxID=2546344 RepID=UPI001068A2AA|nr:hypothetical protein [Cumulibacter soli]
MTRVLIRVNQELSDELLSAFPYLTPLTQPAHTTLSGNIADQSELQGVLNYLDSLGITIIDVTTIPE